LEHIVERALIISTEDALSFENVLTSPPIIDSSRLLSADDNMNLDHTIAIHIRHVLERTHGRIEGPHGAAKLLGIKPGKLRYQLSRLGVPFGHKDKATG
jgi:transcriptional regulator with GAF, ATPase, and Fis domain